MPVNLCAVELINLHTDLLFIFIFRDVLEVPTEMLIKHWHRNHTLLLCSHEERKWEKISNGS